MSEDPKVLYRYEGFHYGRSGDENGFGVSRVYQINCHQYRVEKETPKGFWINGFERKWVPKKEGNRWAHETKEQALASFIARKKRAIKFASSRLKDQEMYLAKAEMILEKGIEEEVEPSTSPLITPWS